MDVCFVKNTTTINTFKPVRRVNGRDAKALLTVTLWATGGIRHLTDHFFLPNAILFTFSNCHWKTVGL